MRQCHIRQINSKENNYLFSPAIFDPSRSSATKRGRDNIAYLRHIVLDFENGDLRPEELPDLFPGVRMVVTNTFRHTSDKPRFRAILLTSEIMTPQVYSLIYGFLADKLEDAGFSVDRHGKKRKSSRLSNSRPSGLDWSKRCPTSLFYLPCQAADSSDSFFIDYSEGRSPLIPSIWLKNIRPFIAPDFRPVQPDAQSASVNEELVRSATEIWRKSKGLAGRGNTMFFDFAFSLSQAGMDFDGIEDTLRVEAQYGATPRERLAQIPSIMASLKRYRKTG